MTGCNGDDDDSTAEEPKTYTVAIVQVAPVFDDLTAGFTTRMTELGYVEGQNMRYVVADTPEAMMAQINPAEVDVYLIVPAGFGELNYVRQMQNLAPNRPIVFVPGSLDPVAEGLADSLERPGGDVTGILMLESGDSQRFDIFLQMIPDAKRIYMPYNPDNVATAIQMPRVEAIAEERGIELIKVEAPDGDPSKALAAVEIFPEDVDGIFLMKTWFTADIWFREGIIRRIPVSQDGTVVFSVYKPLLNYGPDSAQQGRQVARMVDLVLKGTKVSDLPIENSELYLSIDLGVADAIAFEVPQAVLDLVSPENIVRSEVEVPQPEAVGACNAQLTNPGGTNTVCVKAACDTLQNNPFASYSDKVDVESCSNENLVGICDTAATDTYYYDGESAALGQGCGFMGGTWTPAAQ